MHHDPLDKGGAAGLAFAGTGPKFPGAGLPFGKAGFALGCAAESLALALPRKIVTSVVSPSAPEFKGFGSNGLTSLSRVTVDAKAALGESDGSEAARAASASPGTRLRRLSESFPISLASTIISLCFGVTSSVAV